MGISFTTLDKLDILSLDVEFQMFQPYIYIKCRVYQICDFQIIPSST